MKNNEVDAGKMPVIHDSRFLTVSYLDQPLQASYELLRYEGSDSERALSEARSGIAESYIARHNQLMMLPDSEEGVDIQRVRSFMASLGAPPKDLKFLSPEDFRTACIYIRGEGEETERFAARVRGTYDVAADVALVKRDSKIEQYDGAESAEILAVHELGHAWGSTQVVPLTDGHLQDVWYGYMGPEKNYALEEAWANLLNGRYADEVLGNRNQGAFSDSGVDSRFDKHAQTRVIKGENDTGEEEAWWTWAKGAAGAVVLERLIEEDPAFWKLLRAARVDRYHLNEVQAHMNATLPGIFERFSGIDPTTDDGQMQLQALNEEVAAVINHDTAPSPVMK